MEEIPPVTEGGTKAKKIKKQGNIFVGLGIFIASLTCFVLVVFLLIIPILDSYVRSIGGTDLKGLIRLYREVTAHVSETDVVNYPFLPKDFENLLIKFDEAGLEILDENGKNIDPSKFDKNEYFAPLELKDVEVAALLDNVLTNYYENLSLPIYSDLELKLSIRQVKIQDIGGGIFKITIVAKANTQAVAKKLGILGGLIPDNVYLTSIAEYCFNEEEKMVFQNSYLRLNKIKDESFRELTNIVAHAIEDEPEEIDMQAIEDFVADNLCYAVNTFIERLNTNWTFVDGGVHLESKIPAQQVL